MLVIEQKETETCLMKIVSVSGMPQNHAGLPVNRNQLMDADWLEVGRVNGFEKADRTFAREFQSRVNVSRNNTDDNVAEHTWPTFEEREVLRGRLTLLLQTLRAAIDGKTDEEKDEIIDNVAKAKFDPTIEEMRQEMVERLALSEEKSIETAESDREQIRIFLRKLATSPEETINSVVDVPDPMKQDLNHHKEQLKAWCYQAKRALTTGQRPQQAVRLPHAPDLNPDGDFKWNVNDLLELQQDVYDARRHPSYHLTTDDLKGFKTRLDSCISPDDEEVTRQTVDGEDLTNPLLALTLIQMPNPSSVTKYFGHCCEDNALEKLADVLNERLKTKEALEGEVEVKWYVRQLTADPSPTDTMDLCDYCKQHFFNDVKALIGLHQTGQQYNRDDRDSLTLQTHL